MNELTQLVDDIGRRSFDARLGHRGVPEEFDDVLWRNLEETGLSRLTSSRGGRSGRGRDRAVRPGPSRRRRPDRRDGPAGGLARGQGGIEVPENGPLTIAIADAEAVDGRISGTATDVPWPRSATVVLAARTADELHVAVVDDPEVTDGHNLAGEPRGSFAFDLPADRVRADGPGCRR